MRTTAVVLASALLATGCLQQTSATHGRLRPDAPSSFFKDGTSARLPVPGTVALGDLQRKALAAATPGNPMPRTRAVLVRGKERFEIACTPCHGFAGRGDGMIVQRGFVAPPSLHDDRIRTAPDSHIFAVITQGHGAMYSYADRTTIEDRWAIAHYIRVLQLSQRAEAKLLSDQDRAKLGEAK